MPTLVKTPGGTTVQWKDAGGTWRNVQTVYPPAVTLARTKRNDGNSTSNLSTYTTVSHNIATDDLVIALVNVSASATTLGITGHASLTWTSLGSMTWNSGTDTIQVWRAIATQNTFSQISFTTSVVGAGAMWSINTFTGYNVATPVSGILTATSTSTTVGPLDVSSLTGQSTFWAGARNSNTTAVANHTGGTLITDQGHTAPTRNLAVFEEVGENSPSINWGASNWISGMMAFKVRAA